MIAITRWEFRQPREALRVVSVAMEALHRLGSAQSRAQFRRRFGGRSTKTEFRLSSWRRNPDLLRTKKMRYTSIRSLLSACRLCIRPSRPGQNPFSDLIASNDPHGFARELCLQRRLRSTDNAPFFFFTFKPEQILKETGLHTGIDWKVNLESLVLLLVLVISMVAVFSVPGSALVLKIGPGATVRRSPFSILWRLVSATFWLRSLSFNASCLFLGHPTYALTVVIFLLMLSSGAGSLFSRIWMPTR